jgi:hypothetical protein
MGGTLMGQTTDWGQGRLRTDFHEAIQKNDLENFQERYDFVDIAENYWIQRFQNSDQLPPTPLEVSSALLHWREQITRTPWKVQDWGGSFLIALRTGFDRPIEFLLALIHHGAQFQLPLFLSLSLLLLLHLLKWLPAIQRDVERYLRAKSHLIFPMVILFLIFWGIAFKSWAYTLFILLLFASIYTRRRSLFIGFAFLFCASLSFSSIFQNFYYSLEDASVVEALQKGRNKLEYPQMSLKHLPLDQQALWAFKNYDFVATRQLLESSPQSLLKKILEINLDYLPTEREKSITAYIQLESIYPNEPIVQFNLAQLYGGIQDLALADRHRSKVNPLIYSELIDLAQRTGRPLLYPAPDSKVTYLLDRFVRSTRESYLPSAGASVDWRAILRMIFPWLLFGFCLWFRNRASGVCQMTGESTSSVFTDLSPLAEKMAFKADDITAGQRQVYLQKRRTYDQMNFNRTTASSWIFAPSYPLFEGQYVRAFFLSFVILSLFTLSLPFHWRSQILEMTGSPIPGIYGSFQFSIVLFLISGGLHYWVSRVSRRKAEE